MAFVADVGLVPLAVSAATAQTALDHLRRIPAGAFTAVNARSRRLSRLRYGRRGADFEGGFRGPVREPEMPPELRQLGEEALEEAKRAVPDAPWSAFSIDTLVVNRYHPGEAVAKHQDPPRWSPCVLGVTLCEDPSGPPSVMQFSEGAARLPVPTPHRSAYVFHGKAYTDAKHERRGSKRQRGTVWSLTYRAHRRVVE